MNPIFITVRVDANEANPNRRMHWRKLAAIKKRHRTLAGWEWVAAGKPVATVFPVLVDVTIRRGTDLDDDNALASLKALRDGLFIKAITPDDSKKYLLIRTVTQEISKEWKARPEVVFSVTQGPTSSAD